MEDLYVGGKKRTTTCEKPLLLIRFCFWVLFLFKVLTIDYLAIMLMSTVFFIFFGTSLLLPVFIPFYLHKKRQKTYLFF